LFTPFPRCCATTCGKLAPSLDPELRPANQGDFPDEGGGLGG
jgi:hypothetical protein